MSAAPEFSRTRRLDTLGGQPVALTIEADKAERTALAKRFGLIAIRALSADLSLIRDGERVTVTGRVNADVDQPCVATGDAVPAAVDEPLLLRFVPAAMIADADSEEIELAEGDCDVMAHDGGAVDLGEAVAETMALALDPFPRSPGADAALRGAGVVSEEDARPASPFAALKDKLAGRD